MTYRGNNVEWLDSVSLTSIINISIGSGGSGWVSRIWQSQYGTIDMLRYNIMWCYMLSTLTKDKIEKKKYIRQCHIDFIAFKYEIIRGGGQMTLLIGILGARKTYPSALAMELRLSWINPSISSLAWVWWVVTKKCGEHSSLLCENAVLINMTDRLQGPVLVCAQPLRDVVTM